MPPKAENLAENLNEQPEIINEIEIESNAIQILMHANDKLMNFIKSLNGIKVPENKEAFKVFNLKLKQGITIESIKNKLQPVKEDKPINILNEQYLTLLKEYLNNDNILTQYKKLLHHLITPATEAPSPSSSENSGK
jgi:hypothetical protein